MRPVLEICGEFWKYAMAPGNMRFRRKKCGGAGKYAVSPEKMRWHREICGDFFKQFHVVYFPEMRWIFRRTKKNTEKSKKDEKSVDRGLKEL